MSNHAYRIALGILLHDPDARLVRTNNRRGDQFHLQPDGSRVDVNVVCLLACDLVPADPGLFPDLLPQSWKHRCQGGGSRG